MESRVRLRKQFTITSYLAFGLLVMPLTLFGGVLLLVSFALLLKWLLAKEPWREPRVIISPPSFIALCIVILILPGLLYHFYQRWLPVPLIQQIATKLSLSCDMLAIYVTMLLAPFAAYAIADAFHLITERAVSRGQTLATDLVFCFLSAFLTVLLIQRMSFWNVVLMSLPELLANIVIVAIVILLIYCVSKNMTLSSAIGASFFMLLSTVNAYVFQFRDRLFEP